MNVKIFLIKAANDMAESPEFISKEERKKIKTKY